MHLTRDISSATASINQIIFTLRCKLEKPPGSKEALQPMLGHKNCC